MGMLTNPSTPSPVGDVIWLDSGAIYAAESGAARNGGSGGGYTSAWLLDGAGADENGYATASIPSSWGTFHVDTVWANVGAGAGDVRFDAFVRVWSPGEDLDTPGGWTSNQAVVDTAGATNDTITTRLFTSVAVSDKEVASFLVYRTSSHASDTLANDIGLIGLKLTCVDPS